MRAYLVIVVGTRVTNVVDLKTAAHLAHLKPDELDYVLGEEGICETDEYTVVDIASDLARASRTSTGAPSY